MRRALSIDVPPNFKVIIIFLLKDIVYDNKKDVRTQYGDLT
ncbi:hypothetical protein HMPREF0860_1448 [Treponema socranskii subsp. socranskii VPI DR56BR1116 = ATCC 35536]|uniref:Uncharacterized protein n=1 Tax=Treponema socranskii subsp. socranskii VPI DR56BR1116 = ATCC 35536 TaxID=1125725 RepID=A0ABP2YN58_TRESO|nr:hypothetical protein HMPREF0860_1448 [Treponema socranskii subsp. socranskii VPI DR56BR1116 = ATCC 35536]